MKKQQLYPVKPISISRTFGTPNETPKDRAKRDIMEFGLTLESSDNETIIIDPDAKPFHKQPTETQLHDITKSGNGNFVL